MARHAPTGCFACYNLRMAGFAKTIVFALEDALTSVVRFPLWWYTRGLVNTATELFASIRKQATKLAIGVWIRNIFTPMYGRSDWQSRLISIIVRVAQICGRGLFLCVLTATYLLAFMAYLIVPVVAVFGMLFHLFGTLFSL
jgi:hypothetical protein